jgi:hypothetical protein
MRSVPPRERRKWRRLARTSLRLQISEGISPASDAALQDFSDAVEPSEWTICRLMGVRV